MKLEYDMTPFLQRLKNKYYSWKWEQKERKTKLYDVNSKFITHASKNGFIHSPFHYTKMIVDFAPVIGNPNFSEIFELHVKNGDYIPIKKELIK